MQSAKTANKNDCHLSLIPIIYIYLFQTINPDIRFNGTGPKFAKTVIKPRLFGTQSPQKLVKILI